nr:MAG TPA: hypothetical protein [Caudoviricetes sp.]
MGSAQRRIRRSSAASRRRIYPPPKALISFIVISPNSFGVRRSSP